MRPIDYEFARGFDAGERAAWQDRASSIRVRVPPSDPDTMKPYLAGWWTGYLPRTPGWRVKRRPNTQEQAA